MADENKRGIGARSAVARIAVAQTAERVGKRKIIQNHFENGVTVIFFLPNAKMFRVIGLGHVLFSCYTQDKLGHNYRSLTFQKKIPLFFCGT